MVSQAIDARGSKKPFIMRKGISVLADLADGQQAANIALQGAKTVFYCEGNSGSDTSDGLSWDTAFKTLTVALAASNADIAVNSQGWASRNVILCKADAFTEDLVLLAQKTDVIGVGHHDRYQTGLIGNHVPTGATASYGTRFFNFHFMGDATTGADIWTLDTYNVGLEFHNCFFDSVSGTAATAAIIAEDAEDLKIVGCEFMGAFSDAVIELSAGNSRGTRILSNYIEGANDGIHINSSVIDDSGGNQRGILIQGNVIRCATYAILDSSNIAMIIDNRCMTAADLGAYGAGCITGNTQLGLNNWISGDDTDNNAWPVIGTLGAS